jgi:regulator of protease activity HflC (stomatin/prohibitin superfamily)
MSFIIFCIFTVIAFGAVSFFAPKGRKADPEDHRSSSVPPVRGFLQIGVGVAFLIITGFMSAVQVDSGRVVVTDWFGEQQSGYHSEGLHFINPIVNTTVMETRRQDFSFTGETSAEALSGDKIRMVVDVTVPYILQPHMAWKVKQKYGIDYVSMLNNSARSAIRDAVSAQNWEVATSEEGRAKLASDVPENLSRIVMADLINAGFTADEAAAAFIFPNAQVRKFEPVSERVLNAIADEKAADVELRRQATLTNIAEQAALRQEKEGLGIAKMMGALPQDVSIQDMVAIINANAAKTNAEAFEHAVKNGNPNITVVTGGNAGISVSAGK